MITAQEVHAQIDATDSRNPALGAKIVAKAWADPEFKARLLADARSALGEMGIETGNLAELTAVENTPDVHHVVVCTLCSCYPRMVLGIPPAWYKSTAYRSRVVAEPRVGLCMSSVSTCPTTTEVRVLDSTADMRFLVIPQQPAGTEQASEAELSELVTRDCMIGTGLPRQPS